MLTRMCVLVHSAMSPTCLAAELSILLAPTVWQCRRSSWQPLVAFAVVGPWIWNYLLDDVTSAESLSTFRQRLKAYLFLIIPRPGLHLLSLVVLEVVCIRLLRPL